MKNAHRSPHNKLLIQGSMNITKSVAKLTASNLLITILGFISLAYFTRKLGSEILGIYFLCLSVARIMGKLSSLGIFRAIEKRISEGNRQAYLFTASIPIIGILSSIIFLFPIIFKKYVNSYLGGELTSMVLILFLLIQAGDLIGSVLKGERKIDKYASMRLFREIIRVFISISLIECGLRIYGLLFGFSIAYFVSLIYGIKCIETRLAKPSMEDFSSIFEFAKYSWFFPIRAAVFERFDILIIGLFLDQSMVGLYGVAKRGLVLIKSLSGSLGTALLPQVSQLSVKNMNKNIQDLFRKASSYSLIVVVPCFFGSLVLAYDGLDILFGEYFRTGGAVLIILSFRLILRNFNLSSVYPFLLGMNRPDTMFKAGLISVATHIICGFTLLGFFRMGIEGMAWAACFSAFLHLILNVCFLRQMIEIRPSFENISWIFFSSVTMFSLLFIGKTFIRQVSTIYDLIGYILAGTLTFTCLTIIQPEYRNRLRVLLSTN